MSATAFFYLYTSIAFLIAVIALLWGSQQKIMGASLLLGSIILSNLDYAIFGFIYPDINIRMYFYIAMDLTLALLFINIFTNRKWLLTNRWAGAVAIIHILMISVNFAGKLKPEFGKTADHALTLNVLLISAFVACLVGFMPKSPDEVSSVLKLKYRYLKNDLLKRWLSRAEVKLPSSEKENDLVNAFIGQKIKQLRRNANMSQEDLGKILGVSQTQINRIEVGKKRVSAAQLFAFSKLFKIEMNYFTDGIEAVEAAPSSASAKDA